MGGSVPLKYGMRKKTVGDSMPLKYGMRKKTVGDCASANSCNTLTSHIYTITCYKRFMAFSLHHARLVLSPSSVIKVILHFTKVCFQLKLFTPSFGS